MEVAADNGKDSSRKEGLKQLKDDKKEAAEKMNKEQRVESISLLTSYNTPFVPYCSPLFHFGMS